MAVVKNLMVRAGADFSGMRKEMEKASKNLQEFKSGMNSALKGIGVALAGLGIGAVIKDATKSAMNVEASIQQINRTMVSSAKSFMDWANNNAIAFNMSKADATKFGAVYSNLISGFANSTALTTKYTEDLLKESSVVASATGRTMDDVMERIRSGLLGNTEAIEDLGINVNVAMIESTNAFKKFANGKHWEQLDFQTQQQIRLFAILEQSSTKYGDTVNNNTNSKLQQFVAQMKNVQLSLGQAFLPILNVVLPALTAMASGLSHAMNILAQFTQALFGQAMSQTKATDKQAAAVANLGDAYQAAGQAAQGAVAGFDEVNTLSNSSGAGSGSGTTAPQVNTASASPLDGLADSTVQVSQKVQEMANKVKDAFKEMSDFITTHKEIIAASLAAIGAAFITAFVVTNWVEIIAGIRTAFLLLDASIGGMWAALTGPVGLIVAAVALVVGAFTYFYLTNEKFRGAVDGILKQIGEAAVWLWNSVLVPFGQWLGTVFVAAWKGWTIAAEWLWKNVLVPLGNTLMYLWNAVFVPVANVLSGILGLAFQTVADIAKDFWKTVLVPLGQFFADIFQPTVEAISTVFSFLWNDVLVPFGTFLSDTLKPYWEALGKAIEYVWHNVLEPIAGYVSGGLKTAFHTVFEGIRDLIGDVKTAFIGLMNFITDTFQGNWKKAWEDVKKVFEGTFGALWDIAKTPLNLIIDGVNTLIRGLNSISIDIPNIPGIPGAGTKFGINIPYIPKLARGGITNGPMLAMIGDNPGGQEVVSPLDGLLDMIQSAVATAIMSAAQFNNNRQGDVIVNLDGITVARLLSPYTQRENSRIGAPMISSAGSAVIVTT